MSTNFLVSDLDVTLLKPHFKEEDGWIESYIEFNVLLTCEGLSAQVAVQSMRYSSLMGDTFTFGYGSPDTSEETSKVIAWAENNKNLIEVLKQKVSEALDSESAEAQVLKEAARSAILWTQMKDNRFNARLFDLFDVASEEQRKVLTDTFPSQAKIYYLTQTEYSEGVLHDLAQD